MYQSVDVGYALVLLQEADVMGWDSEWLESRNGKQLLGRMCRFGVTLDDAKMLYAEDHHEDLAAFWARMQKKPPCKDYHVNKVMVLHESFALAARTRSNTSGLVTPASWGRIVPGDGVTSQYTLGVETNSSGTCVYPISWPRDEFNPLRCQFWTSRNSYSSFHRARTRLIRWMSNQLDDDELWDVSNDGYEDSPKSECKAWDDEKFRVYLDEYRKRYHSFMRDHPDEVHDDLFKALMTARTALISYIGGYFEDEDILNVR